MRIALILASNLYMAPYVRYYTEILDKYGVVYDIIAWDRNGVAENGVQAFKFKSSETRTVFCKVMDYIRYRSFVKLKLAEGNYDKVIVFTIVNALVLLGILKSRYKNNYVFDIRDDSVARKYFQYRFSTAIQNAAFVVISSTGFKRWLPKDNAYLIRHNTQVFRPKESLADIKEKAKYKITTIGLLRYFEANKVLIEQLGNLSIFELEFVGSGPAEPLLKDLAATHGIKNVKFFGQYAKQDEPKYLEGTALISILMDDCINSITLMSNRFYLSVVYGIPMMVDSGTEQAKWVEKFNLGVVINKKSGMKEQIVRYLQTFDLEVFNAGRKKYLEIVRNDIDGFEAKFKEFLSCDAQQLNDVAAL